MLFSPGYWASVEPGVLYVRSEVRGQLTVLPQLVRLLPHEPGERWC
ncbi:MAG: hypothetical protein ACRDTX_12880 [Pseudonocardiaceae bacterium]